MAIYEVVQGEFLAQIARRLQMDWRKIYEHPQNADFKKKRPNPNVLYPGDQIFIPDPEIKVHQRATDATHQFTLKPYDPHYLRIVLKDDNGKVIDNQPCTLEVDGKVIEMTTDGDGKVEHLMPADTYTAKLTLKQWAISWDFNIGHLDPTDNVVGDEALITGVQARLNNLGFYCGPVDGDLGPLTRAALQRYQQKILKRDDPTGDPDPDTRSSLLNQHGA